MVLRGMNVLLNLPQRGVPQDGRQRWQRHSILRRPGRERVPQIVKDEWNGLALFPARFQNVVVAVLDGRRVKCGRSRACLLCVQVRVFQLGTTAIEKRGLPVNELWMLMPLRLVGHD